MSRLLIEIEVPDRLASEAPGDIAADALLWELPCYASADEPAPVIIVAARWTDHSATAPENQRRSTTTTTTTTTEGNPQ